MASPKITVASAKGLSTVRNSVTKAKVIKKVPHSKVKSLATKDMIKDTIKVMTKVLDPATMSDDEKIAYLANLKLVRPTGPHPDDKEQLQRGFPYRSDPIAVEIFKSLTFDNPPKNRKAAIGKFNKDRLGERLEDEAYLEELHIIGLISKGGGELSHEKDFPAIALAYNLKVKYAWDSVAENTAEGYLARGWNNLHSSVVKNKVKFDEKYGSFIKDFETFKANRDKKSSERREKFLKKQAAKKASST